MFTQSDVQILASLLPSRAVKRISRKTKISRPTIYKFLNGKKIRTDLAQKIYEAGVLLAEENKSKETLLRQKSAELLKDQSSAA